MNKSIKRALTLLLALCLTLPLASVMPVLAESESAGIKTVEYSFYNPALNVAEGTNSNMVNDDGSVKTELTDSYPASINNVLFAYGGTQKPKMGNHWVQTSGSKSTTYDFQGLTYWCLYEAWIAFKIQSPGAGSFDISLNYWRDAGNTQECSVYILPGSTGAADIESALNTDNRLENAPNLRTGSGAKTVALGAWDFTANEEYLVVFKSTKDYNGGTSATLARMPLISLTMQGQEKEEDTTPITGEYLFYNSALGVSEGERKNMNTEEALNILKASYDQAETDITFIGAKQTTTENPNMVNQYVWNNKVSFPYQGLMYWCYVGNWVAYQFRSPGDGNFNVSLNYFCDDGNNTKELSAYLLPCDTSVDSIDSALDKNSLIGTADLREGTRLSAATASLGRVKCEAGKEYIIVFKSTKDRNGSADGTTARMHLIGMTLSQGAVDDTEDSVLLEPISLGSPVASFVMTNYAAIGEVNGDTYYYAPAKGGKLYVYNLTKGEKVDEENTGFGDPRCCIVDSRGILYVSGAGKQVLRYDPYTGTSTQLPEAPSTEVTNIYSLALDDHDNLYMGTSGGHLYKYDIASGEYEYWGTPESDATYLISLTYHDGYLYAEAYGDKNADNIFCKTLMKIDAQTKEVVASLDLCEKLPDNVSGLYFLSIVGGNTLIGGNNALPVMIAVDLESFQFIDIGINSGNVGKMSDEVNGKSYFVAYKAGLQEYDIATRTVKPVEGFESAAIGLRSCTNTVVYLNDPAMPGATLVTNSASNGAPVFYNLETKTTHKWEDLVSSDGTGQILRSLTNGSAGSGDIYIGTYGIKNAIIYNTNSGSYTRKYMTVGQTDSQIFYNGKIYAGCYPGANLVEVDPIKNTQKTLFSLKTDYSQTRIHTITAGDGKVFAGTTPDTGLYGGCIAWYDIETGETYVERNVVQDQTIQCLVYYDGFLYGTTSKMGGSSASIEKCPAESAVIFVYDVLNKKKVAEYEVGIDGIENAAFIPGIAADPNEPGKFWGVVSETLFSFTVDPDTHEIKGFKEEVSYSKTYYNEGGSRHWFPRSVLFGDDGYLYVGFTSVGGFRKINPQDPTRDSTMLMNDWPAHYVLGEDNNLYYAYSTEFKKLELNMEVNDAVVAERVQILIDAIGTVNARSKWTIDPAREAYNALTENQKALVTNYATLTAAEAAYAEIKAEADKEAADKAAAEEVTKKIEAIGTVTLSSEEAIKAARAAYEALTEGQKKLVDEAKLTAAEAKLAALKTAAEKEAADKAAAEAVTKQINAIGEVTLNSEEAIKAARAAYEALTADQKKLVDTAKLAAAEAKLAELKAEAEKEAADKAAAEAVTKQIAAIGTVTLESRPAITAARAAYEALTAEQKALVGNLNTLSAAEASLAALETPKTGDVELTAMLCLMVVSAAAISTMLVFNRRRKQA